MAIIQPETVAARLRRTFTTAEADVCRRIIEALEGELEEWTGKALSIGTHVETLPVAASLDAFGHPTAVDTFLSKRPVLELVSARRVDVDPPEVIDVANLVQWPWGVAGTAVEDGMVEFTYRAGIDGAGDRNLRGLVLRAATREMAAVLNDSEGLKALSAEGTRYDYVNEGEGGFTEKELAKVKRRRRVAVA